MKAKSARATESESSRSASSSDPSAATPANDDASALSSTSVMSLRILEAIAKNREESALTHLAAELGVPKARIHRHLTALRQDGYVSQNPRTSRYRIGWRLFLLSQQIVQDYDVVALARPVMEELRDKIGQTIVITTYTDDEMVVLNIVPGRSALEIILHPGTKFRFHTVAQGKIAMAFGPPTLLERTLGAPLEPCTPHTITDPERLKQEIELVRKRHWAEAPEEVFTGVNALAAPVFQPNGTLFGALAIVGSIHYLPARADPATVEALKDAAARLSKTFGASES